MQVAVSTWALHRTIGTTFPDSPSSGKGVPEQHSQVPTALHQIPGLLRERGFDRMELCHFHIDPTDGEAVDGLKKALAAANVTLQTLLIDDGDISDPVHGARDEAWIAGWIEVAGRLGAQRARVIAGKQPYSPEVMALAIARMKRLAKLAETYSVRLVTENWFALLATPSAVHELLTAMNGELGLCLDYGNWSGSDKYLNLAAIAPSAETCHAKCEFLDGDTIDFEDYDQCLGISAGTGFRGPFTLVNGGPVDEWRAVELSRKAILDFSLLSV